MSLGSNVMASDGLRPVERARNAQVQLEARVREETTAAAQRLTAAVAHEQAHTEEARRLREQAVDQASSLRLELQQALQKLAAADHVSSERLQRLQVDVVTLEARRTTLESQLDKATTERAAALDEKRVLEGHLATATADKRALEELVRRMEAFSAAQLEGAKEVQQSLRTRLEAAASERLALLQQQDAAATGWRRAQEHLAAVTAEKRAADAMCSRLEELVAMWQARCERMEVAVRKAEAWGRLDHRHRDEMAAVVTGPLPTVARSAPASPPPLLPPSTPLPPPSVLRSPVPDALTRAVHLRVAGTASPSLASLAGGSRAPSTIDDRERHALAEAVAAERVRQQEFVEHTLTQQQTAAVAQQRQLAEQLHRIDAQRAVHECALAEQTDRVLQRERAAMMTGAAGALAAAAAQREADAAEASVRTAARAALASMDLNSVLKIVSQAEADAEAAAWAGTPSTVSAAPQPAAPLQTAISGWGSSLRPTEAAPPPEASRAVEAARAASASADVATLLERQQLLREASSTALQASTSSGQVP